MSAPAVGHAGIGPHIHLGAVDTIHGHELSIAIGINSIERSLAEFHVGGQRPGALTHRQLGLRVETLSFEQLDFIESIDKVYGAGHAFEHGVELVGIADGIGTLGDIGLAELGQKANTTIAEVVERLRISPCDLRPVQIAIDHEANLTIDLHGLGLGIVNHHTAVAAVDHEPMTFHVAFFHIKGDCDAIAFLITRQRGISRPKQAVDTSGRQRVHAIDETHELRVELVVGHVNVPGDELARRVELEQNAINDHRMNKIHGVLTGQSVHDAIASLQIIHGVLRMGQSTEKLVLAIGHGPAQTFENGLGIALAAVAGERPEILDGAAGRHNERDLALAVFDSRHYPADVLPGSAFEIADDNAFAHELMSTDLADLRIGLDGHFDIRPDVLETAAGMRQQALGVDLDGRKHTAFDVFDPQACLNTSESGPGDERIVHTGNEIARSGENTLRCNPGGRLDNGLQNLAGRRPKHREKSQRLLQLDSHGHPRHELNGLHIEIEQLPWQGPFGHLYGRSLTRGNRDRSDGADALQLLSFVQLDVGVAVEPGRNCSEEIVENL